MNGARFSPDRRYRYVLTRRWSIDVPGVVFIMLNPSIADEQRNDPTVARCQRRARDMGFGALHVLNLFAFVSTDPAALLRVEDPVGPDNDAAIAEVCENATMVICAWGGTHRIVRKRAAQVLELLADCGVWLHALRVNSNGSPGHPLYLPYSCRPVPYPRGTP